MDRPFRARDCTPSLIGEATSREGGKSFRNPSTARHNIVPLYR